MHILFIIAVIIFIASLVIDSITKIKYIEITNLMRVFSLGIQIGLLV